MRVVPHESCSVKPKNGHSNLCQDPQPSKEPSSFPEPQPKRFPFTTALLRHIFQATAGDARLHTGGTNRHGVGKRHGNTTEAIGKVCLIIAESRVGGNGTAAASHLGSAEPSSSLCSATSPRGCSNQHRAPEIHATRLPKPVFANPSCTTRKQTPARVAFINPIARGESTALHFASKTKD